jgi:hypothetical protein
MFSSAYSKSASPAERGGEKGQRRNPVSFRRARVSSAPQRGEPCQGTNSPQSDSVVDEGECGRSRHDGQGVLLCHPPANLARGGAVQRRAPVVNVLRGVIQLVRCASFRRRPWRATW